MSYRVSVVGKFSKYEDVVRAFQRTNHTKMVCVEGGAKELSDIRTSVLTLLKRKGIHASSTIREKKLYLYRNGVQE